MRAQVEVVIEADGTGNGDILVRSPAVGHYGFAPRVGEVLVGGSRAGRLTTLGRSVDLTIPAGTTGRVAKRAQVSRSDPVEYGQPLLRLVPVESEEVGDGIVSAAEAAAQGLESGTFAVTSSTHGMFYRRPGPDAPVYVEKGQVVDEGATLGLVEVMKCFSAITYGGKGLPDRAEILEVRVEDGAEVQVDQILFVVRSA